MGSYNPVVFNGSVTLTSGTFTAPSGTMSIFKNFNRTSATFNHNNGTIVLNGINRVITGENTFYNLEKIITVADTLTFPASTTTTVLGTLTLKGAAGNVLSLRSSTNGTQYSVNPANVVVEYLNIRDFNNTGASVIQAAGKNVVSNGNNLRWNFDNPSITNVEPIYLTNGSNIANNKPTYVFYVTDPQASDTVKYQIQIDNNSDFSSPEAEFTSTLQAQGSKTFTPTTALADGSYYTRFKGIDSNEGDGGYSVINNGSVAFTVDTTKPTGSVFGAYKTDSTSRDIYLVMTSSDSLSGVNQMMISENSNFSGGAFEEYKTSKAYTVSDGYGTKTIYVKFRDRAGNESIAYSTTVEYSQQSVTPSITPNPTQVPVSYGTTPIGGNLTDGLSVIALRVVGRTNNPLANVSINIPALGIVTTTDENGLIVLENVPLGDYDVLGIFNNKEFNQLVEISPDNSLITIKLEDAPNRLTIILLISVILLIVTLTSVVLIMKRKLNKVNK